jgi:predicted O-linked N-acetylglucosamine transferase (SPINDLY family)
MRGILNHLPGDRLRPTVVCSRQAGPEILGPAITNPAVALLPLPGQLSAAAERLRAAELDLLIYWEVGTDGLNYFLPFHKLAPVQCSTWGWPSTSGIPGMDFYLSWALLETGESDRFYSERLVRLRHLPTYYYRPAAPSSPRSRAELGFGSEDHLYLCSQNLRKVQPDFDALLGAILRRDPSAQVLFIRDAQPGITERLRRRFVEVLPDVVGRIRFLPRMGEADYLNLIAIADVVLDTLHYGGGANTTLDALAVGTPIVTLPGRFQRGRWACAAYELLGVTDCVAGTADEYVDIALRMAVDPDARQAIRARFAAASPALFENMGAVEDLVAFCEAAGQDGSAGEVP